MRARTSLTGWETDFSAQTGAMQMGILIGNNDEIPAYRWWDRKKNASSCRVTRKTL